MIKIITTLVASAVLVGCAMNDYPCGEPNQGTCSSVSQHDKKSYTDYKNPDDLAANASNSGSATGGNSSPVKMNFKTYTQIPGDGAPLLSAPKMVRVWFTPYTDVDNIYHDQAYEYMIVDRGRWNYSNNRLLEMGDTKNVTMGQVSSTKGGGYGAYGLADQPVKPSTNPTPVSPFPAINALQNQQSPIITTTTVGSGIDRTTTITP